MTSNQIAMRKQLMDEAHNQAMEQLQSRQIEESRRHNVQTELEATRSNRAREGLTKQSNDIMFAHNYRTDTEAARHNRVLEGIQSSYNEGQLGLQAYANETNRMNVTDQRPVRSTQADLNQVNIQYQETKRKIDALNAATNAVTRSLSSGFELFGNRRR